MSRKGCNYSVKSLLKEQIDELYCEDLDYDLEELSVEKADRYDDYDDDCGGCANCIRSKPFLNDDHPIFAAVAFGHLNQVKCTILNDKASLHQISQVICSTKICQYNKLSQRSTSLLQVAILSENYNIANLLITEGVDLNYSGILQSAFQMLIDGEYEYGYTINNPTEVLSMSPYLETIKLLINSGANTESYRAPVSTYDDDGEFRSQIGPIVEDFVVSIKHEHICAIVTKCSIDSPGVLGASKGIDAMRAQSRKLIRYRV